MVERESDLMNWRFDGRTSRFSLNRMVQPFVFLQHQNNVVLMLLESKWCYFDDFLKYLFLSRTPGSLPNFNSCRLLPTTPPPPTPVFAPHPRRAPVVFAPLPLATPLPTAQRPMRRNLSPIFFSYGVSFPFLLRFLFLFLFTLFIAIIIYFILYFIFFCFMIFKTCHFNLNIVLNKFFILK